MRSCLTACVVLLAVAGAACNKAVPPAGPERTERGAIAGQGTEGPPPAAIAGSQPSPLANESFTFDPDELLVLVPVRVGNKDYPFFLDTGATWSVFDVSLRSHLGPRVKSVSVGLPNGRNMGVELHTPPDARVGSLPLAKEPVVCHDLTPFREASGCNIRGTIGMDFLKDWIIAIDFDEGRLDILPPETEKNPQWGEGIPFVFAKSGSPLLLATVGEKTRTPFLIDTGWAGTGGLNDWLIKRLVSSNEARITGDNEGVDVSGRCRSRVARLSQLSLGPFRHESLRCSGGNGDNLGLGYLSRYRVTIDFPGKCLYLAKGKRFADHDLGRTCGLGFSFKETGVEVAYVDEKGPAHTAGVRVKDVVVKLGGKPISEWKSSQIHRLLRANGKTIQLTVERDGKPIELSFVSKEYD